MIHSSQGGASLAASLPKKLGANGIDRAALVATAQTLGLGAGFPFFGIRDLPASPRAAGGAAGEGVRPATSSGATGRSRFEPMPPSEPKPQGRSGAHTDRPHLRIRTDAAALTPASASMDDEDEPPAPYGVQQKARRAPVSARTTTPAAAARAAAMGARGGDDAPPNTPRGCCSPMSSLTAGRVTGAAAATAAAAAAVAAAVGRPVTAPYRKVQAPTANLPLAGMQPPMRARAAKPPRGAATDGAPTLNVVLPGVGLDEEADLFY